VSFTSAEDLKSGVGVFAQDEGTARVDSSAGVHATEPFTGRAEDAVLAVAFGTEVGLGRSLHEVHPVPQERKLPALVDGTGRKI
jgi:hypothetical protein